MHAEAEVPTTTSYCVLVFAIQSCEDGRRFFFKSFNTQIQSYWFYVQLITQVTLVALLLLI